MTLPSSTAPKIILKHKKFGGFPFPTVTSHTNILRRPYHWDKVSATKNWHMASSIAWMRGEQDGLKHSFMNTLDDSRGIPQTDIILKSSNLWKHLSNHMIKKCSHHENVPSLRHHLNALVQALTWWPILLLARKLINTLSRYGRSFLVYPQDFLAFFLQVSFSHLNHVASISRWLFSC